MSESERVASPSEELAQRIARRLVEKGLLKDALAPKIAQKIAQGKMDGPDWKLAFEISLALHKTGKKE